MSDAPATRSFLLTPAGAGAIGVIRVAGPCADAIVEQVFRPVSRAFDPARSFAEVTDGVPCRAERVWFGRFVDHEEVLDDVIVSLARVGCTPGFDICAHGGVRVMERILETLERVGAPLGDAREAAGFAWPTEDRVQREAVEALSCARTARAVRFLAWQRRHLGPSLKRLALRCRQDAAKAREELAAMLGRFPAGRRLVAGATVAIEGPANSGKSTLLNRLAGRTAAVVSPRSGTTRDWVTAEVELDGIPVTLIDTAGRHDAPTGLERRAIEQGSAVTRQADVSLLVLDGAGSLTDGARKWCRESGSTPRSLIVLNKLDQGRAWHARDLPWDGPGSGAEPVRVSALTGTGVEQLVKRLVASLGFDGWSASAPCLFTWRQRGVAHEALSDLWTDSPAAERAIVEDLIGT